MCKGPVPGEVMDQGRPCDWIQRVIEQERQDEARKESRSPVRHKSVGHGRVWLYLKGTGKPSKGSKYGSGQYNVDKKGGGGGGRGIIADLLFYFQMFMLIKISSQL